MLNHIESGKSLFTWSKGHGHWLDVKVSRTDSEWVCNYNENLYSDSLAKGEIRFPIEACGSFRAAACGAKNKAGWVK